MVLPTEVRQACAELVEEQHRSELLRSHGLEPRHAVLLLGPPGNGKTSLAEAIGGELAVPVLRVRYDAVVGSFLGETASRLGRVFDHARTRQCVLFFDEFDAVGKERGDEHETGEIKRVVNHAKKELKKDGLIIGDAINVLSGGIVEEAEWENGDWRYRVRTSRIVVVVALNSETKLTVITAWKLKS